MIELMVVLVVLAIAGAVAFAGFRADDYRFQHDRFVEDVRGMVVTARNYAIDNQTEVRVSVDATSIEADAYDPQTNVWSKIDRRAIEAQKGALLENNSNTCIYGIQSGVLPPSAAVNETAPSSCLGSVQVLMFEADGSFSDPGNTINPLQNAGVTLWIADRKVSGEVLYSWVQVFPGGLIRAVKNLEREPS